VLGDLWQTLLDYLKRTPYWNRLEPVFLLGFLYAGASVVSFQYIQWRYGVTLELPLFLRSYLFRQVTVVFWALVLAWIILTFRTGKARSAQAGKEPSVARRRRALAARVACALLVLAAALLFALRLAPHSDVSSIRVMFAPPGELVEDAEAAPAVNACGQPPVPAAQQTDALVYILFELNRLQRAWHFEVDFTPFTQALPSGTAVKRCQADDTPPLCLAEAFHDQERRRNPTFPPLVVITPDKLDAGSRRNWFWQHRGPVSVITTRDWRSYCAPSLYEYLAYTLILQGVLIHLDAHCGGIPPRPSETEGVLHGNVFEYQPRREAMKAAILSGHLGPEDERLLLNCLGPQYMETTAKLLRLDWLRTDPVRGNLRTVYGVEAVGARPAVTGTTPGGQ
jgi:hypothetical protein